MKEAIFHLKRDIYGLDSQKRETTLGKLFDPSGEFYCYTLEDVVRPYGVKHTKSTAIPATDGDLTYKMSIRESPKYGEVVVIYTREEDGVYHLENGGISFKYILCHGGNHADHTEGCILVNKNRTTDDGSLSAWGSMKDQIKEKVKELQSEGFVCRLRVTNLPQVS